MKNVFKKLGILCLALLIVCVTGCEKENLTQSVQVEGSLEEIMEKLYKGLGEDTLPMLENQKLTSENIENYVGTSDISYKEGLSSEPLIGSIAHSVVLLRAKNVNDVEKMKEQIKENINPRKWVCVWVEDEDVIIKNKGDLVIAILIEDETIRNQVSKNFDNL